MLAASSLVSRKAESVDFERGQSEQAPRSPSGKTLEEFPESLSPTAAFAQRVLDVQSVAWHCFELRLLQLFRALSCLTSWLIISVEVDSENK